MEQISHYACKAHFTKDQINEMYRILFEIYDALRDKSANRGGLNRISVVEIGWLIGIEGLFNKIHGDKIPAIQDSS